MFICNDYFYNDDNLSSLLLLTPYVHNSFLTKYFLRIVFSESTNKLCPLRFIFPKIILLPVIQMHVKLYFFLHGTTAPSGPPHFRGFAITLGHTTLGRAPLDEWSARHRSLYLTTHNTRRRQISTFLAGFEPKIPASERPQTHALGCAATGTGMLLRLFNC